MIGVKQYCITNTSKSRILKLRNTKSVSNISSTTAYAANLDAAGKKITNF